MIIRLGYVAMTLNLKDCSPSKTVTAATYNKIDNEEGKKNRLRRITRTNLENTLRILKYNLAHEIEVYRFTSKLVPLATYTPVENWNYEEDFIEEFKEIGDFVKENDFRVSAHPDHFTLINSPNPKVFEDSLRDLEYHYKIYRAMGLSDKKYKLVLHIGGMYEKKELSIQRFIENFKRLPEYFSNRLILENDDKIYTAPDVLSICKQLNIPMVFDVHHYACNNSGENIIDILPAIFDTWNSEYFKPKIHFSSPKSEKKFRNHADDIDVDEFIRFLDIAKELDRDFDVMLEAKNKDNALFNLMEKLRDKQGVNIINQSTIEY
ncbi:UV DNA damage repair endonuclease UvsE [Petroclostridium sp. X23]|uniref:UV DNA damage repair endonuclease UvsE n=1 Tax=Petroclostridium sp. X23 TaxID=3045146 RepID=UPI0024ADA500|nr:UV DNA damage repair endonuclease UvsE [Petroclostridium sp. X23]WHH59531.1 UV DNA damage repair endonuclease UvsE [Petroclostridium sp. X23]